jgi:hypothetical protein
VQSVVADAIRANRDRLSQQTIFSGKVFRDDAGGPTWKQRE